MNCKNIQELILTGYSDGEITPELAKEIDEHLKICPGCRKFKEAVEETALSPFRNAQRFAPPDALWEKVREAVVYEKNRDTDGIFLRLRDALRVIFNIRKPVLAFAAAAVVILVTTLFMRTHYYNEEIAGYLEDQVEFIAYLDTNVSSGSTDYMNLDVKIEDILSQRNFYAHLFV